MVKITQEMKDKMSGLDAKQKAALAKHARHNTKKHMDLMILEMSKGVSFSESHKKAQEKYGE